MRVALHHEFQRLLIDELPDTDPIQAMDRHRPRGDPRTRRGAGVGTASDCCVFLFLRGSTTTQLYVPDLWEATEDVEELPSALAGPEPSWRVSPGLP